MAIRAPYLKSQYFDAFKRVRNRLRRFDPGAIVVEAIERLHAQQPDDIESLKKQPPWFLFLLIKWTIVYGDFLPGDKLELTPQEFNGLINRIHDIDGSVRLPSQYDDLFLFLRGMAYQQFWHQELPSRSTISRQAGFFHSLDRSHRFRRWFFAETGLEPDTWIDLSFGLLAGLTQKRTHFVTESFFSTINADYPLETIRVFLRSVSRTPGEIRTYLAGLEEEGKHDPTEFRERTPLVRYPLINLGGRHYYYSLPLLQYSLENFIYDTLKRHDSNAFMNAFGPLFERYVCRSLEYSGVPFRDEADIRSACSGGKVVDFVVPGDEANILIDAKGVEMAHTGMTSHRPEVISGQVKSSILKGIQQACETARVLSRSDPPRWCRDNNFLMIVTFKNLYLGTGGDLSSYVVRDRILRALGGAPEDAIVPVEHMYILSVDEFDYLMEVLKQERETLSGFLRYCVQADKEPQTKCIQVSQHLSRKFENLTAPEFIEREFRALIRRVAEALGVTGAGA